MTDLSYIYLSIQRGLLDRVSSALRAVTVEFVEHKNILMLRFFYDGEIDENLYDLASSACAETDPGIFPYTVGDEITIRLDYPQKIPIEGRLVYLRNEPIPTFYKQDGALLFVDETTPFDAILLLAMQDALLGIVTPELRQVSVNGDHKQKQIDICFFYDGEISQKNSELAKAAINEMRAPFPGFAINEHVIRLDFPEKIPSYGGRIPYARYEG